MCAQLCLSISHLEMIYGVKRTSKRAGVREGSKLWSISAVHHIASGSFALLSALVWRAGKSLAVKKREIKLTEDQTGDPFGRDLAEIFAEQLLGRTNFCPGWLMSPRASVWLRVFGWAEGGGAMPSHVMPSCIPITPRKWSPETFKVTKAQTLFVDHRTTELEIAERFFSPW